MRPAADFSVRSYIRDAKRLSCRNVLDNRAFNTGLVADAGILFYISRRIVPVIFNDNPVGIRIGGALHIRILRYKVQGNVKRTVNCPCIRGSASVCKIQRDFIRRCGRDEKLGGSIVKDTGIHIRTDT